MNALGRFHTWLKGHLAALPSAGKRVTYDDGYRQGYRNAVHEVLEYLEELEWDELDGPEWAG